MNGALQTLTVFIVMPCIIRDVCVCTDMCLYNLHTVCVCVCVCPLSSDHGILKKQDLSGLLQSESMVDLIGTLKCKH